MPISFACDCGKQLKVADAYAGKRAKCPACKNPVTVPAAEPPPSGPNSVPESDEEAAFRALSEGPDPVPTDRGWRAPDVPSAPPPPVRPPAAFVPRPPEPVAPTKPRKSKARDPYAERGRKWVVDWRQIGGGLGGIGLGTALLLIGLANNRFIIWSVVLLGGGVIGVLNGLFNVSRE